MLGADNPKRIITCFPPHLALAFLSLLSMAFAGCAFHFNSPTNAQAINTDVNSFNAFTGTNSGLLPKVQDNINAQLSLIQTVDTSSEKLNEVGFGTAQAYQSWISIRAQMWKDFGILTNTADYDKANDLNDLKGIEADLTARDNETKAKIDLRIKKVQAIAKLLQTLANGQAALAKLAAAQASTNLTALTNLQAKLQTSATGTNAAPTTNAVPGTNVAAVTNAGAVTNKSTEVQSTKPATAKVQMMFANEFLQTVNQTNGVVSTNYQEAVNQLQLIQSDIISAGEQMAADKSIKTNATALEKIILQQAKDSKDPASVYALVAVIGSGLSSQDMALLDNFITNLQARIVETYTNLPTSGTASLETTNASSTSSNIRISSQFELRTHLLGKLRFFAENGTNSSPTETSSTTNYLNAFTNSFPIAYQLILAITNDYTQSTNFRNWFARSLLQQTNVEARQENSAVTNAQNLLLSAFTNVENTLPTIASDLPTISSALSDAAQSFQVNLGGFQDILQNTNLMTTIANGLKNGVNTTNVLSLLLGSANLDPKVASALTQDAGLIDAWGQVAKSIQADQLAATARLLNFFYKIQEAQTSLYQENARHYNAINAIGAKELTRWAWIRDLYQTNSELNEAVLDPTNVQSSAASPLFMDTDSINAFQDYYTNSVAPVPPIFAERGYTNTIWQNQRIFPPVMPTDKVLPSIRLLAENANSYQASSPSIYDPTGQYTQASLNRLDEAIELILNYDFIINYNRQQADTLHRILIGEIDTHSVNVDTIAMSTYEANIALQLGNSQAFHNGGLTQSEMQLAIQTLIQTGLLSYIGAKQ